MSAAQPLITARTTSTTQQFNAVEYDVVCFCTNTNVLGAEVISINVLDSAGQPQPLYNPVAGLNYQLTASAQAVTVPGGFLYRIDKPNTVAATGVDVLVKPRSSTGC